jgi:hypothetical protein
MNSSTPAEIRAAIDAGGASGAITLYINGALVATSSAFGGPINNSPQGLLIGMNWASTTEKQAALIGSIFDARVYNVGLTAAEILTIAKSYGKDNVLNGLVLRTAILDGAPEANLNGVTIKDHSPYKNNVAATGSPTAKADPGGITRMIGG